MKRKLAAGMLVLFLAIRLLPAFSSFWAEQVSLKLLGILSAIGSRFPFVLLEWLMGAACAALCIGIFRRKALKTLFRMGTAVLLSCLVIWYPLYFRQQNTYSTKNEEISALCESLIDELNAFEGTSFIPSDLPGKFVRFPEWMDALRITGLCSFLTGEALVTPELDAASLPFVAVHEDMHLRGHAGEGAANIAAWEECMARGGAYARSARIWALRYGMGILRREAYTLYETNMLRMSHETLQLYREAGGAYAPAPQPVVLRRLCAFLGIEGVLQDYENLARHLAARGAE